MLQNEERREYSEREKAAVVEGYRTWQGSQLAYAASVGIPQSTISGWLVARGRPQASVTGAPTMLEVVRPAPVPAAAPMEAAGVEPTPVTPVSSSERVRIYVGQDVSLDFESAPSPQWVAALAAELRRC